MIEIDHLEYLDFLELREEVIKLAVDLVKVNKDQFKNSKLRTKQKPTTNHWKARGSTLVTAYLLEKYPVLLKLGKNPQLYSGNTTRIYKKKK